MADATKLRPQWRTRARLEGEGAEIIAALVRKLGGEARLRFRDLHTEGLTVWHDVETDEMVLLAKEPAG